MAKNSGTVLESWRTGQKVNLWIKEGTEVHGPDGWIVLTGDVSIEKAVVDSLGQGATYTLNSDVWRVLLRDAVVTRP